MKKISIATIVFSIIALLLFSVGVSADSKTDSLTIICRKEDVILSNMEWKIYYIADISENGSYNITDEFSEYPVELSDRSTSALQNAASKYETYTIIDEIVPLNSGVTDKDGQIIFGSLKPGLYLVTGETIMLDGNAYIPVPSLIELKEESASGTSWTYDLMALPKLKVLPESTYVKANYTVEKVWKNDNEGTRPQYVTAVLYRNGVEFTTAILNEQNGWEYIWRDLPQNASWEIKEKDASDGYEVSYNESDDTVTIINTYTGTYTNPPILITGVNPPSTSQKLPQTGMQLWIVPLLGITGVTLFIVGWFLYKRGKNEK